MKWGASLPLLGWVSALVLGWGLALHLPPLLNPGRTAAALPEVGTPAPHFSLPQLHNAAQHKTPQDWRGRVWVLVVWASWCGPCREEHPALLEAARQEGVTLIGLNFKDDPRDAQEWLLKAGDPYLTTLVDRSGDISAGYGVRGVPEAMVIDTAGNIRHRHAGPVTARVWTDEVLPIVRRLAMQSGDS